MFNYWRKVLSVAVCGLWLPVAAWASPDVVISIRAEKEVIVSADGKEVKKMVQVKEAVPGETILYTLDFSNKGTEAATDVAIIDPIPAGAFYVAGSATDKGDLSFSVDGGNVYKKPSLLTYEVVLPDGIKQKHIATPEQYTHIRWIIPKINVAESGQVSFSVKVK